MDLAKTIKNSTLFHSVDENTVKVLAAVCHPKKLQKGQELFAMGDSAEGFYIILKGWIKLYRVSREGEEAIINVFGPGESFAEAAVFSDRKAYPVNAQAIDDTDVIEIPRNFFVQKIEEDPQFALRMLGAIASRQHYLVQQLEQVTTRTAPQRIGAFLLRFCTKKESTGNGTMAIDLPYDKSVISTRLNIKPETFSRALAKLEPYGVEIKNRSIIITDPGLLADYCDFAWNEKPC